METGLPLVPGDLGRRSVRPALSPDGCPRKLCQGHFTGNFQCFPAKTTITISSANSKRNLPQHSRHCARQLQRENLEAENLKWTKHHQPTWRTWPTSQEVLVVPGNDCDSSPSRPPNEPHDHHRPPFWKKPVELPCDQLVLASHLNRDLLQRLHLSIQGNSFP